MSTETYEAEIFEKVMTVVRAALQNPHYAAEIELKTSGYKPSASVTVPAYVFEKFLKKPKAA